MSIQRSIFYLALWIALGLVTTVAIAWSSASWRPKFDLSALRPTWIMDDDGRYQMGMVLAERRFAMDRRILEDSSFGSVMGGQAEVDRANIEVARRLLGRLPKGGDFPPPWGWMPDPFDLRGMDLGQCWAQSANGWPMLALWCEWYGSGLFSGKARLRGGW